MGTFTGNERFSIVRELGSGGMGVVYEVYDRVRGHRVALKCMRETSAQSILRFKREFRALQGNQHPNLVALGELFEEEGCFFFTMELIHGVCFDRWASIAGPQPASAAPVSAMEDTLEAESRSAALAAKLRHAGPCYDEVRLRNAFGQLALGLSAIHQAGKVHRDIKASNVMVGNDGQLKILDFGLLTDASEDNLTTGLSAVGTAAYMAPEQAAAKPVTAAADWYSAGVLLYYCLTAQLPFEGSPLQISMDKQRFEPPPPRAVFPEVPSDLDALCCDLLRTDPEARPRDEEVFRRLGIVVGGSLAAAARSTSEFTQSTPFVGREDEMKALGAAYRNAQDGTPTSAFLVGGSGYGKSALARHFLDSGIPNEENALVLSGRCYEREVLTFKALDGIVDQLSQYLARLPVQEVEGLLPQRADLLPQLFPALKRVEGVARARKMGPPIAEPQLRRAQMFAAFRELLLRLCARRPLVLFVDDFQWTDADSLGLLFEIFRPPNPPQLFLLATLRSDIEARLVETFLHGEAREVHTALGEIRRIKVEGFSREQSERLIELLSPHLADQSPTVMNAIVVESQGHPFFVQEMVRYVESQPSTSTPCTRLVDALWSRIVALPEDAKQLLDLIAVAAAPLSWEVAALAMNLESVAIDRALSILRISYFARTNIVGKTRTAECYHDRIRQAVFDRIGPKRRTHLHSRLVVALERSGAAARDPHLLIRHLEAAGEDARAATLSLEVSKRATDAGAFDQAATHLTNALRLGEFSRDETRDVHRRLANVLANAGRGPEAAENWLTISEGADRNDRLAALSSAAKLFFYSGRVKEGLAATDRVLREARIPLAQSGWRSWRLLLWTRLRIALRRHRWRTRNASEIPSDELATVDVLWDVGNALVPIDPVRGMAFQSLGYLLALRAGETRRLGPALCSESLVQSIQGAMDVSWTRLMAARSIEGALEEPYLRVWTLMTEGAWHYFKGKFAEVIPLFQSAEELLSECEQGTLHEKNLCHLFHMFAARHSGQFANSQKYLHRYLGDAERQGDLFAQANILRASTIFFLASGGIEVAETYLNRAAWNSPEGTFHLQHWYELEARAEIAIYEGTVAENVAMLGAAFERMDRSLVNRLEIVRVVSTWLRGRIWLSLADEQGIEALGKQGLKAAKRSCRVLARSRASYAIVFAKLLEAGISCVEGKIELANDALIAARAEAKSQGMRHHEHAAEWRLGELARVPLHKRMADSARDWYAMEGIIEPHRINQILVPGFGRMVAPGPEPG